MSEFRLKVEQFDDEPAWSVLYRLGRLSGAGDAKQFCLDWELDFANIVNGADIDGFARRGGYDADKLLRSSIRYVDQGFVLGSEALSRGNVSTGQNRVCQRCLENDFANGTGRTSFRPHWRDWWFIHAISACPFHGIRISVFERATNTGRLDYRHDDPLVADLEGTSVLRKPIIDAHDTDWEAYLLGRFGFMDRRTHWLLDRYPMSNTIMLVCKFGESALRVTGHPDPTNADPYEIYRLGFRTLQSRETIEEHLDDLFRQARVLRGKWGQRMVYGPLYDSLNQTRQERHTGRLFDSVRQIIFEHAWRTFPINPKEEFFGNTVVSRNIYTLYHLWKETGYHTTRLRPILLKLDMIDQKAADGRDEDIFVSADDAERLGEILSGAMTQKEMLQHYGIPRGTYPVIRSAGLLRPWLQTGSNGDGDQIYLRDEVDDWFACLKGPAPAVEMAERGMASLPDVTGIVKVPVDKVVSALIAGELKCRGVMLGAPAWSSIILDVGEVRDMFSDKSDAGFLGQAQTIERLRSTHAALLALVAQGHLVQHTRLSRTKVPKACFDPADIDRFDATYMSMKVAAKHVGSHSRVLRQRLDDAGISPAFDLRIGPAAAYYLRSEIEALPKGCFRSWESQRKLRGKSTQTSIGDRVNGTGDTEGRAE